MRGRAPIVKDGWERESKEGKKKKGDIERPKYKSKKQKTEGERIGVLLFVLVPRQGLPTKPDA